MFFPKFVTKKEVRVFNLAFNVPVLSRDSWGWATGELALPPDAVLFRRDYTACLRVQDMGTEMDSRGVY